MRDYGETETKWGFNRFTGCGVLSVHVTRGHLGTRGGGGRRGERDYFVLLTICRSGAREKDAGKRP